MNSLAPLAGKRIGLTGATRGIGKATALALLEQGAAVFATARDPAALKALENQPSNHGPSALAPSFANEDTRARLVTFPCDLTSSSAREGLVARAAGALGGLDGWVNCAGIADHAPFAAATRRQIDAVFEVNFYAALDLCVQAGDALEEGGAIVNVASTLAIRPARGTGAYSASKAALVSASQTLALELAPKQIRVNTVVPGVTDTDMIRGRSATELEALRLLHPLGRFAKAEEVASAIVYLLHAPWTTGTVLPVDGGQLL